MMTNRREPTFEIVRSRDPNALSTSDTVDAFLDLMEHRLGIAPGKIMLADSICSDDLNVIEYPSAPMKCSGRSSWEGSTAFPSPG